MDWLTAQSGSVGFWAAAKVARARETRVAVNFILAVFFEGDDANCVDGDAKFEVV